jgi:hypothetical protein
MDRRRGWAVALGYATLGIGMVLMVLGILEIGGLFNVAIGLIAVCLGLLLTFAGEGDLGAKGEDEFDRLLR